MWVLSQHFHAEMRKTGSTTKNIYAPEVMRASLDFKFEISSIQQWCQKASLNIVHLQICASSISRSKSSILDNSSAVWGTVGSPYFLCHRKSVLEDRD